MSLVCSYYLNKAMHKKLRKAVIDHTIKDLEASEVKFDAIAVRGTSGLLIGPSVADRLGKDIIVVRKESSSHSSQKVEGGEIERFNYIILDDLISSGETVREIVNTIENNRLCTKLVGIYLYSPKASQVLGCTYFIKGMDIPYLNSEDSKNEVQYYLNKLEGFVQTY